MSRTPLAGESRREELPAPLLSPPRALPSPAKALGGPRVPRRAPQTQIRVELTPGTPDWPTPTTPSHGAELRRPTAAAPARKATEPSDQKSMAVIRSGIPFHRRLCKRDPALPENQPAVHCVQKYLQMGPKSCTDRPELSSIRTRHPALVFCELDPRSMI